MRIYFTYSGRERKGTLIGTEKGAARTNGERPLNLLIIEDGMSHPKAFAADRVSNLQQPIIGSIHPIHGRYVHRDYL